MRAGGSRYTSDEPLCCCRRTGRRGWPTRRPHPLIHLHGYARRTFGGKEKKTIQACVVPMPCGNLRGIGVRSGRASCAVERFEKFDILMMVGLLPVAGCDQNYLATYRLPRVICLSNQFPAPQAICLSWSPRRGQAGCGRPWPGAPSLGFYPIKVTLTQLWGGYSLSCIPVVI